MSREERVGTVPAKLWKISGIGYDKQPLLPPEELCCTEQDALEVIGLLHEGEIEFVLDGGWGVDALMGEQTRDHRDIDIIISIEHADGVKVLLETEGFAVDEYETDFPNRLVMVDVDRKLMVDCHLIAIGEDGSGLQVFLDYMYTYSAKGLRGKGRIGDMVVSCLSREEQIRCRTGKQYSFDDSDRIRPGGLNADIHDLSLLEVDL